jgi:hypothetical protein
MGAYENSTSMQNNGLNGLLSQLLGGGRNGGDGLLGNIGGLLRLLGGNTDWNGMTDEQIWEAISHSTNISNNLFPGGDGGGGLDIWDALAGP